MSHATTVPRDCQADMPLQSAVERFLAEPIAAFTTPGHKRAPWLADPLLACDLPLAAGADDTQLSHDVLARAERLAAELWGADHCRFAVNGSTQGNQALALAVGRPRARVAVSRTVHKSLFAGLLLAGLEPVWMYPEIDPSTGLSVGLSVDEVQRALSHHVCAVLVVEPAYTGIMSNLPAIAKLAHGADVPLVVDQAWGAHLGLHPALPSNALQQGADAMVISVHKTLAGFTQGAMLFVRGNRLDTRRVDAAFDLINTTSPSAAIYGSLDRARHIMAHQGEVLLERALELAMGARARLGGVDGLRVLESNAVKQHPAAASVDPVKLVLSLAGVGANGFDVEHDLYEAGVRVEMADRDTLVPLLTIGDDQASVDRLVTALLGSLLRRRGDPRKVAAWTAWGVRPEIAMTPRDAFFARSERIRAVRAEGRISAEMAAPYPPGIPALAPGEVITGTLLGALQDEATAGTRIAYCSDPTLQTVLVVADR